MRMFNSYWSVATSNDTSNDSLDWLENLIINYESNLCLIYLLVERIRIININYTRDNEMLIAIN